jgi:hypothetical protein
MKTSSAPGAQPPIDKPTAWACTLTNAFTLPGLGTVAGGRKIGYAQAACALLGLALSLLGLIGMVRSWMRTGVLSGPAVLTAMAGVGVFGGAWLWALGSSLSLLRQARRNALRRPEREPPP